MKPPCHMLKIVEQQSINTYMFIAQDLVVQVGWIRCFLLSIHFGSETWIDRKTPSLALTKDDGWNWAKFVYGKAQIGTLGEKWSFSRKYLIHKMFSSASDCRAGCLGVNGNQALYE